MSMAAARDHVAALERDKPQLYQLVLALGPAARIEPSLIRKARRTFVPDASPSLEARFWWDRSIGARGEVAVAFDPEVARLLRVRLRRGSSQLRASAVELIRQLHKNAAPLVRFEEELIALTLIASHDRGSALAGLLDAALRTLLDRKPGAADLARWSVRALPDMSLPPLALQSAQMLAFAAASMLGRLPDTEGRLQLEQPPNWLMNAANPASDQTRRQNLQVTWHGTHLTLAPEAGGFLGDHELAIPAARLPTIHIDDQYSKPRWIEIAEQSSVPLPAEIDSVHLKTRDGASYRLEDAFLADARPALRVLLQSSAMDIDGHEEMVKTTQQVAETLNDVLRQHAGLHADVHPVLTSARSVHIGPVKDQTALRKFSIDDDLWFTMQRDATLFVTFLEKNTPIDALLEPTGTAVGYLPDFGRFERTVWVSEGPPPSDLDKALDKHNVVDCAWGSDPVGSAQLIAQNVLKLWRQQKPLTDWNSALQMDTEEFFPEEPEMSVPIASAVQALAMTFHLRSFYPQPPIPISGDFDQTARALWGLPSTDNPIEQSEAGSRETDETDAATQDFRHLWGAAEYLFGDTDYLTSASGLSGGNTHEDTELANALRASLSGEGRMYPPTGASGLRAFARFASRGALEWFQENVGDPIALADALENRRALLREKNGEEQWSEIEAIFDTHFDEILQVVERFETRWRTHLLRMESTLSDAVTYPEYMEGLCGQLAARMRALARAEPDTIAIVPSHFEKELEFLRGKFDWAFKGNVEALHARLAEAGEKVDGTPYSIQIFADLVSAATNALVTATRAAAARHYRSDQQDVAALSPPLTHAKETPNHAPVTDAQLDVRGFAVIASTGADSSAWTVESIDGSLFGHSLNLVLSGQDETSNPTAYTVQSVFDRLSATMRTISAIGQVPQITMHNDIGRFPILLSDEDTSAMPGKRKALLIAVDSYQDKNLAQLKVGGSQLKLTETFLSTHGKFDVHVLTGDSCTRSYIFEQIQDLVESFHAGDSFLLYFSGHAFVGSQTGTDLQLLVQDSNYDSPDTWLKYADVERFVRLGKQSSTVMFIDTCFSGVVNRSNYTI